MARYDYGLRGPRDMPDRRIPWRGAASYDAEFGPASDRPTRVTARYNMDYVHERGPIYPRNPNRFAGPWRGQIGGEESYRPPYVTRGGTRTSRGAQRPIRYDYRDLGPGYGGRYPDEI